METGLRSPRLYTFLFNVILGYNILAGLLHPWIGSAFALVAMFANFLFKLDRLPDERLAQNRKLAALFSQDGETGLRKRIVLHRGGAIDTPENTIEAIREAARLGVAGVEVDLQFTADNVGILLHDDTLDRTTDGTGDVRKMQYADLQHLDAAAKHVNKSKYNYKVKIPTLEECLAECVQHKLLVFLDCKAFAQQTAELVDRMINKYTELHETLIVCSFYPQIVYTVRKHNPKVLTALTYRKWVLSCNVDCVTLRFTGVKSYVYQLLDLVYAYLTYGFSWFYCGNSFLLLNKESVCRNEVNWWKNLGVIILPWTVNSKAEKQFCLDCLKIPIMTDGLDIPE